ncbi:PAS domain-containing sensor histidine kinase [Planotetraspora sp. A-T 1434]|uniref:PAS domain-containing sensor histidine kinase n=1 Tax=Planotetraspora sp. A-T 1434 TaxID=2979219 RepID=UPI0021BEC2ED|nr:PAS domain-containing sensor histidine kinase [Planotetraspora sp. A-T 1434]MCT9931719.1 PAS domain-containing sensor histidine kinase [Planotetraspora sp. A-T 1434]
MKTEIDYEAMFNAGPVPTLLLTPDFTMVAANDAFLEVTQRTRAELIGHCVFTAFPDNPDTADDPEAQGIKVLRDSLERVLATGKRDTMALQRYDVEPPGMPGVFEERHWSTVNTPVLGPDGKVKLIIHSTEEVTDFLQQLRWSSRRGVTGARAKLKAMENHLYARNRELQDLNERLKQTHREQTQTTSALRDSIRRQRQFVIDASHDLRNPIAGLLTELEVALSEPHIDMQQILRRLLRNAERLNDIVADLLALARLDTTAPAATELIDLAQLVVDELERRTVNAAVHPRLDQHVTVYASRIPLTRLLANLLANAERHTSTKIEIVVTTDPPEAVLEVIDDGPGIAPGDRERIFERLYRLDDARRQDPGGSGLGLSIAREIAQAYGGRLYAADHPTGARFVLRLPLAA